MSNYNLVQGNWIKAQGTNVAANAQITTGHAVLHSIVVNSHSTGTFRLATGTATSLTYVQGTYTPATGSSVIELHELEFEDGIYVVVGGTINLTAVYNDLI